MASVNEGTYLGDFLKFETDTTFCRDTRTILAGSGSVRTLLAGTIVAQLKTGVSAAVGGNTGDGVATLGALGSLALTGVYTLTCVTAATDAGDFEVETPTGAQLATLVVVAGGATDVDGHFTYTIADGAADFVVGDSFTVTISDGKIVAYDDTATDTTLTAIGVMVADAEAADGTDGIGVILARGPAVITKDRLAFPAGADAAEKQVVYDTFLTLNIKSVEGV